MIKSGQKGMKSYFLASSRCCRSNGIWVTAVFYLGWGPGWCHRISYFHVNMKLCKNSREWKWLKTAPKGGVFNFFHYLGIKMWFFGEIYCNASIISAYFLCCWKGKIIKSLLYPPDRRYRFQAISPLHLDTTEDYQQN